MAKTARSGVKPPTQWRCMVEGCAIYGQWQTVRPGEEFDMDTTDPRGHYWLAHYLASEAEYAAKVAAQREERIAHYKATGEFLPPRL